MVSLRKRVIVIIGCAVVFIPLLICIIILSFYSALRSDLEESFGSDYAILRLNCGGEPVDSPKLGHMLGLVKEYSSSSKYRPSGTGSFTGKRSYLAVLAGNNKDVALLHWSFRKWGLDSETYSWNSVEKLPTESRNNYKYLLMEREKRHGLWFLTDRFNDESMRFYARACPIWVPSGTGATRI
jgi:hypothetical protein